MPLRYRIKESFNNTKSTLFKLKNDKRLTKSIFLAIYRQTCFSYYYIFQTTLQILCFDFTYSLFHSARFVFHSMKYIFHTVVFIFHSVKQRIDCLISVFIQKHSSKWSIIPYLLYRHCNHLWKTRKKCLTLILKASGILHVNINSLTITQSRLTFITNPPRGRQSTSCTDFFKPESICISNWLHSFPSAYRVISLTGPWIKLKSTASDFFSFVPFRPAIYQQSPLFRASTT